MVRRLRRPQPCIRQTRRGDANPSERLANVSPMYPVDPPLECDLILKGGITSGVIYPPGICELARTYRLRSIGGSSAGAIAAAAGAAAELGRRRGGFEALERLNEELASEDAKGRTRLLRLFRPEPQTRRLFGVVAAALGASSWTPTARAALVGYWPHALLGAVPGVVVAAAGLPPAGPAGSAALAGGILLALIGIVAATVAGVLVDAARRLPRNGFGLVGGAVPGDEPALTPWLHERLQQCAGRAASEPPVTFGDLADAGIRLRVMTTNLTQRRPMVLPFDTEQFWFDPVRWRELFGAEIVDHLLAHPPALPTNPEEAFESRVRRAQTALAPLPDPRDLPIVVATRLSLSFPFLMSAVPLHGVDWADRTNQDAARALTEWRRAHPDAMPEEAAADPALPRPVLSPQWFIDGGATSNLPLHFFDSPLPSRPTFAMNLLPFVDDAQRSVDETRNSHLPRTNAAGLLRRWTPLPPDAGLPGFAGAILTTFIDWADDSVLTLPGYRDRIVRVYHARDEGGYNLRMPGATILRLGDRGRGAAAKLVDHFAGADPGGVEAWGWANHRWVRLRASVTALADWLQAFDREFHTHEAGSVPWPDLAGPGAAADPPSYPLDSHREAYNAWVGELLALSDGAGEPALRHRTPRPQPAMRLVAYDRQLGPDADRTWAVPPGV